MRKTTVLLCMFPISALLFCAQPRTYDSPPGYNLSQPEKFILKRSLHEISGIIILSATNEIGSIQDEDGKFYHFKLGDENYAHADFGKKGDYEDVALFNNKIIAVLRSDGTIFTFSQDMIEKTATKENKNLLPAGEYEGMYADNGKLYVLCKHCPDDNQKKELSVYTLQQDKNDSSHMTLQLVNHFKIDLSPLHERTEENKKPRIHPSCLAKNPLTHEWYLISSVNKLLIILDEHWKIEKHYALDPSMFRQPEGIAFDASGDLFISNEGGDGDANILKFTYNQAKQ